MMAVVRSAGLSAVSINSPYAVMTLNRFLLPLGLLCGLLTSCLSPYPPNPRAPLAAQSPEPVQKKSTSTASSREQQRIREARAGARRKAANSTRSEAPSDPSPPPKKDFRTGVPIPGKEGFVFNPFTNNPVDVRAIPPGTLVRDPQDPNADHKFRVP